MSRRKLGRRVSGLCLIIVGLLAFTASAQAEGNFWIEGELLSALEPQVDLESEEDTAFTLKVPAQGITLLCPKFKLDTGSLLLAGKWSGTMLFEACKVTTTEELELLCIVDKAEAGITTNLVLHSSKLYDLVSSSSGPIATLKFSGAECKLPKELKLSASFVLEDIGGFEKEAATHLLQFASESLFKALTEKNEVTLTGSMQLKLAGVHAGQTWKGSLVNPEGDFRIEGANIGATEEVQWEVDNALTLLLSSLNLEIPCNFSADSGLLLTGGASSATLLFTKCSAFQIVPKLTEITACAVNDITASVKGTLIKHTGKTYNVFESAFIIKFSGTKCTLPKEVSIQGALALEEGSGKLEAEAEKHLFQQATAALFPCYKLKFGQNELRLDGSIWMKLAGKNAGKTWSGLAL
jgi:hypothetical protein